MLNKKGQIAPVLLFVGVFVLIGASFFIFAFFNDDSVKNSREIDELIRLSFNQREFIPALFEKTVREAIRDAGKSDFRDSFERELKKHAQKRERFNEAFVGNFFGKIRNSDYTLNVSEEGIYTLEIDDIFVVVKSGGNEARLNFNLFIEFDEEGVLE